MRSEVKPRDLNHGSKYDLEIHDPKTNTTVLKKNMEFDGKRLDTIKEKQNTTVSYMILGIIIIIFQILGKIIH